MGDFFPKLLDTSDFPARWRCGNWSDFLGWLHILSDIATWGAYFAIPMMLIYFARKRQDFPFTRIYLLFAAFILACGTVHLIEAAIFWHPVYRLSGLVKLITAVVSWATVIALVRVIPKAMHLPSLAARNEQLKTDVEQRKQDELALRAAKGRYEALLLGTRSIVWTSDARGAFTTPQISWERYTGQNWAEHKGFGWANAVHEADRPGMLQLWNSAVENGAIYRSSGRLWHQDSNSYRWFVAEAVPVFAEDHAIQEWVGTVSDVEEQHQAEEALVVAREELARQKNELELIYEAAPVGMSLIDRNWKFLRINKRFAEINGVDRERHIGRDWKTVLDGMQDQLQPIYAQVFRTGEPVLDVEIVGSRQDGTDQGTWLSSYFPLYYDSPQSADGSAVTAVSAIIQDITDRKRQEERLREGEQQAQASNRSKSEFLANMSHEIRTPMAAILGYADVLLGHLENPDNRNCVLVIKRNGQYLLELINDILDLSRIEANKFHIDIAACNLPQMVAEIRSLMQIRANEKQLALEIRFESPVPETIHTDATRLRQVLINLLGNAIKFTEKGTVTLSVCVSSEFDPQLEFTVTDTGIGMNEEQQARLFKPFSQGDASVTRQYGGSGLGLAISQRLVKLLGGTVTCSSAVGQGTTFRIALPIDLADGEPWIQPAVSEPTTPEETESAMPVVLDCSVLVIDDRRDVRHIIQHFLEKAGAKVAAAENGQAGYEAALAARAAREPFDLIVMDMQMPIVDGLTATSKLRAAGLEEPIIALTADAMKGDRERCLSGGCDDYLSKPIDHAELIRMVAHYTQRITRDELRMRRTASLASNQSDPP